MIILIKIMKNEKKLLVGFKMFQNLKKKLGKRKILFSKLEIAKLKILIHLNNLKKQNNRNNNKTNIN